MKQEMSPKPRRVLILAYDFPPSPAVGGLRPYGWYKFLKSYGIEPVVVTRQWSIIYGDERDYISPSESNDVNIEQTNEGVILKAPFSPNFPNRLMLKYGNSRFKFFRKVLSFFWEIIQYYSLKGPKSTIYQVASDYLKHNKVDVILATGEPFILFKYASKLSKKYNIPWLADYRDLWLANKKSNKAFSVKNILISQFERRFLKSASEITTVSEFLKENLAHSFPSKKIHVHPNGYDPSIIHVGENIKQASNVLTLSFNGYIYDYYPVEQFLNSCQEFLQQSAEHSLKINFYGISASFDISKFIEEKFPSLLSTVSIYPKMEEAELIKKMRGDNALILFNSYAILGTKIFNYIAIGRRILLCFDNDSSAVELKNKYYPFEESSHTNNNLQKEMLNETKGGITLTNGEHLVRELCLLHKELSEKGEIKNDTINVEKYSRRIQTKNLADVLHAVIDPKDPE